MKSEKITSFPPEWLDWVSLNLQRGCDPQDMVRSMVAGGNFLVDECCSIIEEMAQAKIFPDRAALPEIDTRANLIHLSDMEVEVLAVLHNPKIVVLGNVLSHSECDELVHLGMEKFSESSVVADNGESIRHAHRTSYGAFIGDGNSELAARIDRRLAELSNWPVENGEGLQLLRYERDHEYKPHFDWFDPNSPGGKIHLQRGGQRVGTFVIYLSDVEAGGGTSFPEIGFEVRPKKGGAVFFANTDNLITPDKKTLHAGDPVVRGVKYVANKWLREKRVV